MRNCNGLLCTFRTLNDWLINLVAALEGLVRIGRTVSSLGFDLVEKNVLAHVLMQLVPHFPKMHSMFQPIHTHLPTHKRTHTRTPASPTSRQSPTIQWNLYNFLLFSNQKPYSQQMLSRYHCQLSLLAFSDKTLLSDPDVKEFNLPDAPKEQTGSWRDEWASKIPAGLRDET